MILSLKSKAAYCNRRNAIFEMEKENGSVLANIEFSLSEKYGIITEGKNIGQINEELKKIQKKSLYEAVNKKELHRIILKSKENNHIDEEKSSIWLKYGNNTPQAEGFYCYLQDRNIFFGSNKSKCNHCKAVNKSVDHLATQCGKMLHHDYKLRHNEVLKCIHLMLCNRYGIIMRKKLKAHRVEKTVENNRAIIKTDTAIRTDIYVKHNKPDIVVIDKVYNQILIVEIGITSQENIKTVETEKTRKYELLSKEMGQIYQSSVVIVPYVFTWEGLVTRYHERYKKTLKVENHTEAYIQSLILKKTFESVSIDYRRTGEISYSERLVSLENAVEGILEKVEGAEA